MEKRSFECKVSPEGGGEMEGPRGPSGSSFRPAVYEGIIRTANTQESFVAVDDPVEGSFDIYIYGVKNINGALHRDRVRVVTTGVFQTRLTRKALRKAKRQQVASSLSPDGQRPGSSLPPGRQTPRYTGAVLCLLESVTRKAPILGFVRPISYLGNRKTEGGRKTKQPKKTSPTYKEELLASNCLKTIGIGDAMARLRTMSYGERVCIHEELCFVPIQMAYPTMRLSLRYKDNYAILSRDARNGEISGQQLYAIVIESNHKSAKKSVRLIKSYGPFCQLSVLFSGFLDCFGLGSHQKIDKYSKSLKIDVSSSSTEWTRQTNRLTFRPKNYLIFTIDPPSARDLDDAVHISFDSKSGIYEVGVHIADVYYYLQRHRALLGEMARELCTSVYLPHTSFPMLPRVFSSDLCSLLPDRKRPTLSVIIKVSSSGCIVGEPKFVHGIITSSGKFSYDNVDKLFSIVDRIDRKGAAQSTVQERLDMYSQDSEISCILKASSVSKRNRKRAVSSLLLMRKLNEILRGAPPRDEAIKLFNMESCFRFEQGVCCAAPLGQYKAVHSRSGGDHHLSLPNIELMFDILAQTPEQLLGVVPSGVTLYDGYSVSHSLIEEFMLLANQAAARLILKGLPESSCVLRTHDEIFEEKLLSLINYLRKHGLSHIFEESTSRENIIRGLQSILREYGLAHHCTVCEMLRDIFTRAKYIVYDKNAADSNVSTKHYALNVDAYTHFTSPIRRAPDILVHQAIYSILDKASPRPGGAGQASKDAPPSRVPNCTLPVFSKKDLLEICNRSNEKSNSSKNMQRDSNKAFASRLLSEMDACVPSISCVYLIKACKFQVQSVLLYPTDMYTVLLVESDSLDKNASLSALLQKLPKMPSIIREKKPHIELCWKLEGKYVDFRPDAAGPLQKIKLNNYLRKVNDLLHKPFQHKLKVDAENGLIVQTIGIWSCLPVYLIPTATLPPKIVIAPICPLDTHFYTQIMHFT